MKKLTATLFSVIVLIIITCVTAFAADDTDITNAASITVSSGDSSSVLTDERYSTKLTLAEGTTVTVKSDKKIYGLYIRWDKPVEEYSIKTDSKTLKAGKNGFLHEYIEISGGTNTAVITLPKNGGILCDVYVLAEGELPDYVQVWNPPYEKADILVLPTHADDELLFFGGTMPYYAGQLGLRVQVSYLTNHWGEPYRMHELLNGLWTCGITAYPIFSDFADVQCKTLDYAKQHYGYDTILEYQVELIRRFKPQVIIGHDLNGEYGHGMHALNAVTLVDALEKSGDASYFPESAKKYGVWDVPKTYLHLYDQNKVVMDWNQPLSKFGGKTALEVANEAYECHYSQHTWYKEVKTTAGSVYNCTAFGLYRSTVGDDTAGTNDFMEHITSYADQEAAAAAEKAKETTTKASENDKKEDKNNNKTVFLVVGISVIAIFIGVLIAVMLRKTKKKKRRK